MNLTDYPTPITDAVAETRIVKGKPREIVGADKMRDLEREAAAWRAVAEMFAFSNNHAQEEFDALKSQLTQP